MTPVLVRPAQSVDADDLRRLAALDSARPLTGDVLIAVQGGDIAAAMSLDTGAVIADPFQPTANLVDLLRTAAHPAERSRRARRALHPPRGRRRLGGGAHGPRAIYQARPPAVRAVAALPLGRVERPVGLREQRRAVDRRARPTPRPR